MVQRELLAHNQTIRKLGERERGFAAFLDSVPDLPDNLAEPFVRLFSYQNRPRERNAVAASFGQSREVFEQGLAYVVEDPEHNGIYLRLKGEYLSQEREKETPTTPASFELDIRDEEPEIGLRAMLHALSLAEDGKKSLGQLQTKARIAREPRPRTPKAVEEEVVYEKPKKQRYRRSQEEINQENEARGRQIDTVILKAAGMYAARNPERDVNASELLRIVHEVFALDITDATLRTHYDRLMADHPDLPPRQGSNVRPPAIKNHPWRFFKQEVSGVGEDS